MTTQARAVTTETDELAGTIAALKSRLNELETASGSGDSPIGTIVDFIGVTAPNGWAILNGSTITNGAFLYPVLWSILPASFKSGNNIVLPDTRGRVTVHAGGTILNVAVGTTGGAETVTLSEAQMPSHTHLQNSHNHTQDSHNHLQNEHNHTQVNHTHKYTIYDADVTTRNGTGSASLASSGGTTAYDTSWANNNIGVPPTINNRTATNIAQTATNQPTTATNQNTGGGQAHTNLQPYMVVVKILKLG